MRQTSDDARVIYRNTKTGEQREERAAYCVCCLPMAVLQHLDVNLSAEMADAVNDARHSSAAKMGLQMRRRFWKQDDGIFAGTSGRVACSSVSFPTRRTTTSRRKVSYWASTVTAEWPA